MNNNSLTAHLYSRDCNPNEDDILSVSDTTAVFPLLSTTGALLGIHTYSPDAPKSNPKHPSQGKYWTYVPNRDNKHKPGIIYGASSLDYSVPYVFLVEGIFDHFTVKRAGYNSIPVLTNNPQHLKNLLFCLPFKYIIAICEGDKAGNMLKKVATHHMKLDENTDPNSLGVSIMSEKIKTFLDGLSRGIPCQEKK